MFDQGALWSDDQYPTEHPPEPQLKDYDRIIVAFSGGKDSIACVLHLLDQGVERERIHLHHHLVDGDGPDFMDWPVTESYCAAFAKALGLDISYSWKSKGFLGEMLRESCPTQPNSIPFGQGRKLIGGNGPNGTRRKFPQVSASLTTRYCSSYLKLSPFDSWLINDPQFLVGKTLVITGERAEESASRSKYKAFEPHRSDNRFGKRVKRYVDHWRPVHQWTEHQVWNIIQRYRIVPHPCYYLGWGRGSCVGCIFGNKHQWASVKLVVPAQFQAIAHHEREFKVTIHRKLSVEELAAAGTPYDMDPFWIEVARSKVFNVPIITDDWKLPKGAYGDQSCGPS